MKKKIASKDAADLDKHHVRVGLIINGTNVSIYHTPLHEAIKEGNLEAVQLLCSHGADPSKIIKIAQEIDPQEKAASAHHLKCNNVRGCGDIKAFKYSLYVGYSALELAERLYKKRSDNSEKRKAIVNYLRALSKQQ